MVTKRTRRWLHLFGPDGLAPTKREDLRMDEIWAGAFRLFVLMLAGGSFLGWYALVCSPENTSLLIVVCAASLLTVGCYLLARLRPAEARTLLLLGIALLVLLAVLAGGMRSAVAWLALPAIMAYVLQPFPLAALWSGGMLVLALVAMWPQPDWCLVVWPAVAGLTACLALRPLQQLLGWAWQRSCEATALAEQLQEQRAKLNNTIKSLDLSYQLLQQTNRELALARQEAETLRELRHRFAANLSHELRTPLNIIVGFSKLIYQRPQLYGYPNWNQNLLKDLAEIHRSAEYLSRLVDDVVDLARVDALAMPIRREPADLRELVEESVAVVRSLALEKGLTLTIDLQDQLPILSVDRQRIRQVLLNLLTNAVRFTASGSVAVSATVSGGEVVVSVRDTGCGIPEEELRHIFDEFYQIGRPKEQPESGKGLGLAIAKRFVQLHGGRIWAESRPGQGSTFSFSLPLAAKSVALLSQAPHSATFRTRGKPKVLVLDDDDSTAVYLSRRLEQYDFLWVPAEEQLCAAVMEQHALAVITSASCTIDREAIQSQLPDGVLYIEAPLPSRRWISGSGEFEAVLFKPVSEEAVHDAIQRVLQRPLAGHKLLLVDDDRGFLQLLARIVRANASSSVHIHFAHNGQSALDKARRLHPDLILLDLLMPGMSGVEVVGQLRQDPSTKRIPVIAVTAATPGEDQITAQGVGLTLSRKGGFRPGELVTLLEAALAGPNYRRAGSLEGQR
jgi:signal transduction histidine kinase/CheY-like chemotaxis protein